MWTIEYQYKANDGSIVHIVKPMKDSQPVTIGRSNQNTLHIKNDRSISRKHIQLMWIRSNKMFYVNNFGKVTMYQDKYLKVGEIVSLNVPDIQFPIIFQLGTSPVQVFIKRLPLSIIKSNASELDSVSDQLQSYDVNITTILDFHCDSTTSFYIIKDETINPLTKLCALIAKIPFVSKEFVFELLNELEKRIVDFNSVLTNLLDQTRTFQRTCIKSIKGVTIIYLNKDHDLEMELLAKLTECIENNQGSIEVFEDDEKFERYLQLRNSLKDIIILKHPQRIVDSEILTILGDESEAKVFTVDQFINKLKVKEIEELVINNLELNHDIKFKPTGNRNVNNECTSLKSVQGEPNNNLTIKKFTRSLEEPIEPSPIPVKKKRLTRRKIQALNPLEFFAGGSQSEQIAESTVNKFETEENKIIDAKTNEITKDKVSHPIGNPIFIQNEGTIRVGDQSKAVEDTSNDISYTNKESKLIKEILPTNIGKSDPDANFINKTTRESSGKKDLLTKNHVNQSTKEKSDKVVTNPSNYDFKNKDLNNVSEITKDSSILESQPQRRKFLRTKDVKKKQEEEEEGDKEGGKIKVKDRQDLMKTPNVSLVETIQSTKIKEITRYRNNMVQIEPEELTEEAINKFSNMTFIETNSNLIKGNRIPKEVRLEKGEYSGRKNFKKFVKSWPRGSPGGTDSLCNSVHMLTRQFVETKPYSIVDRYPPTDLSSVGEVINESFAFTNNESSHKEGNIHDFENEYLPSPINKSSNIDKRTNELFVNESDDESMWIEPRDNVYNNIGIDSPPSNRKIQSTAIDNDSDDSDEGPRFQFKKYKRKGINE